MPKTAGIPLQKKKTYTHMSVRIDEDTGEHHVSLSEGHDKPDAMYEAYQKKSKLYHDLKAFDQKLTDHEKRVAKQKESLMKLFPKK